MDVDIPAEDAMETDPPQEGKQHPIDPDGDEQMDASAGEADLYDEEGDIEIVEGDEMAESGEAVDADGDITPEEVENEAEEYFYEEEGQAEEADVEIKDGADEGEEVLEVANEEVEGTEVVEEAESKPSNDQVVEGTDVTTLTTPAPPAETASITQATEVTVDKQQAEQGNVAVEPQPTDDTVEVEEVSAPAAETAPIDVAEEVVEPEVESQDPEIKDFEVIELGEEQEESHEHDEGVEVVELEDDEDGEGQEDEEEDSYDLLTYDTLPPILLHLPNAQRALFNPILSEDGTTPPIWFAEKVQEFSEGTLSILWAAIREKLEEEGLGNDTDELVIIERLTDLKMGDSDVNLEDITFLELVQMYHDCELPEPMELHLEFHPHRFITRFNAIQKELSSREVIYIEAHEEDEEDGEEDVWEIVGDEDEKHEDEQGVAEAPEEHTAEPAHTATGQLPVPLPTAEPAVNDDTEPAQDDSEDLVHSTDGAEAVESVEQQGADTDTVTDQAVQQPETDEVAETSVTEGAPAVAVPAADPTEVTARYEFVDVIAETESAGFSTDGETDPTAQQQSEALTSEVVDTAGEQEVTAQTSDEQTELHTSEPVRTIGESEETPTIPVEESTEQILEGTEEQDQAADAETNAEAQAQASAPQEVEDGDDQGQDQGDEAFVGDEVDAEVVQEGQEDAEGQYEEGEGEEVAEGEVEEEAEGEVEEEAHDETEEGAEAEEEYEGDETDPYGVDKLVDGISEDEDAQTGENGHEQDHEQAQATSELNDSEEVLEEYQEETDELSEPVLPEGTNSNGESNGAAAIAIAESDETSPVKRSRSAEAEDEEEAAGKRVKLGENELVSETQ